MGTFYSDPLKRLTNVDLRVCIIYVCYSEEKKSNIVVHKFFLLGNLFLPYNYGELTP